MISENDPRLKFVPIEQASIPPNGLIEHLKDRWWVAHHTKGLVFWTIKGMDCPQCNSNESITRRLSNGYPWARVVFVPSVFRRINPSDYV